MAFEQLLATAFQNLSQGNIVGAWQSAQSVLNQDPENPEAFLILGLAAKAKGDLLGASQFLQQSASFDPSSFQARISLAIVLRTMGRSSEALKWALEANALAPRDANILAEVGSCYLAIQQWQDAEAWLIRADQAAPRNANTLSMLGLCYERTQQLKKAISTYEKVFAIKPNHAKSAARLAYVYLEDFNHVGALACAQRAAELDPSSASNNMLLAMALNATGDAANSLKYAKRAQRLAPNDPEIATRLATIYLTLGQTEEATGEFERAIEIDPTQSFAYLHLVRNRKVTQADQPMVDQMERLLDERNCPLDQKASLAYGIGKAREDLGDFEEAMSYYNVANEAMAELTFGNEPFNQEALADYYQPHQLTISPKLQQMLDSLPNSPAPIIVCGMIRSGSTLIDQILSCHPSIGSVGEHRYWDYNAQDTKALLIRSGQESTITQRAKEYLGLLEQACPGKPMVIDKLMSNFVHLDLLHALYPNAKLIHTVRHPVDTCLSIWSTPNSAPISWAYRKKNIVFASKLHHKLAEYWKKVLPSDRYLEIQYEELVSDNESVMRRTIEFLGLEWSDKCLKHEDNQRIINTPSLYQVRQPVFTSSKERWRRFEPWLDEFRELL